MRYRQYGNTDLKVSELCLGSMTWGTQNTQAEGHAQIDMALDHGVNIIDTAEMYPVNPVLAESIGNTEAIIGEWFAKTGRRNDVVLATKITGSGQKMVRAGAPVDAETLRQAITGSLDRLQTDFIDIYQLHWPNRGSYMFRQNWNFDASKQDTNATFDHMLEILQEAQRQIEAGRIRHFALSNESAWGTANWIRIAAENDLPKVQSLQNEYSLLCRFFDLDLSELSHHEKVGLLAFSPLATGLLSGKYQGDIIPKHSRREASNNLGGRVSPRVWPAVDAYLAIAAKHDLDPCQMALAWCNTRPFMTSVIFGATNMSQLGTALGAAQITLSDAVLKDIAAVHKKHPMPY